MKFIVLVCLLIVGLASAKQRLFTDDEYRNSFTNWMIQNDRHYANDEFLKRFEAFKDNMDFINEWNSKGSQTILGLNKFADLTNEEYRNTYLGTRYHATTSKPAKSNLLLGRIQTASSVDWRSKGAVTPIKNQGQCGGCWSFSTTGSTEGAHQIKTGDLVSLSEQNLIDCSTSYGNDGCGGGLMSSAFEYIIKNDGIDTESSYPFTGVDGKCKYSKSNKGATISSYKNVTTGSETDLEKAVEKTPVSVAIDASHNSFQLYSGGIYYEEKCSETQLDHGVLTVGYGEGSLPNELVVSSSDDKFWIVKNSWGTEWGVQGYIFMSKDRDNNCGIATMASYPEI